MESEKISDTRQTFVAKKDAFNPETNFEKKLLDYKEFVPSLEVIEHRDVAQRLVEVVNGCCQTVSEALGNVRDAIAELEKQQEPKTEQLELKTTKSSIIRSILDVVEQNKEKIVACFEKSRVGDTFFREQKIREQWSVTKEFLDGVEWFNNLIEQIEQLTGIILEKYTGYDFQQMREAEMISVEGRLLTHSAPTATMYEILEKGDLSSVAAQEKNHPKSRRAHYIAAGSGPIPETHDITFEIDHTYRNMPTGIAQIALIFSENQLLSEERPYVDLDGIHVFDTNFTGEEDGSPALSIGLKETPCMILVTRTERDKLLKFLKEKSIYKNIISDLSQEEFDVWVDNNVLVVEALEKFQATPEIKKEFCRKKAIVQRNGYVELTDTMPRLKFGDKTMHRFIPS